MRADETDLLETIPRAVRERVRAVRLKDGIASAVIEAGGLVPEALAAFEEAVKGALEARPGVREARVALVAQRRERRLIAVGSGKGGVGKSTLAANLAIALARSGHRVGLVDADIHGPSLPLLLGDTVSRTRAHEGKLVPVASRWGVPLLSMGHLVGPDQAIAWRGLKAAGALSQLIEAHWGGPDADPGRGAELLLIDLPPGTGDIQLTMLQRHKPAGAVIVTTPQDLALIDARRALALFAQGGVPIIGVVENMAGYACPHCGGASDPFGHGGAEAAAAELGVPFLGRIPLDLVIREASDAGVPPAAGDGPQGQAFAAIAARVADWLDREHG